VSTRLRMPLPPSSVGKLEKYVAAQTKRCPYWCRSPIGRSAGRPSRSISRDRTSPTRSPSGCRESDPAISDFVGLGRRPRIAALSHRPEVPRRDQGVAPQRRERSRARRGRPAAPMECVLARRTGGAARCVRRHVPRARRARVAAGDHATRARGGSFRTMATAVSLPTTSLDYPQNEVPALLDAITGAPTSATALHT
jgi:hypothetical protein